MLGLFCNIPLFILVHKASKSFVELEDEMLEFQQLQETERNCDISAIDEDLSVLTFFSYYQLIFVLLNLPIYYFVCFIDGSEVTNEVTNFCFIKLPMMLWYISKPVFTLLLIFDDQRKDCFIEEAKFSNVIDTLRTAKLIDALITLMLICACIPGCWYVWKDL